MAVLALVPRAVAANPSRQKFNLALARYGSAADAVAIVSDHSTIAREIAKGDALDRAAAHLAAVSPPDHAALSLKLRLLLAREGVSAALVDSLATDVATLGREVRA